MTDILRHHREVYGKETDELIRKIAELSSGKELDEWWRREIGWDGGKAAAHDKAAARYAELCKRAKENGWEKS